MKIKSVRTSLALAAVLLVAGPAVALAAGGITVSPRHPSVKSAIVLTYTTPFAIPKGRQWLITVKTRSPHTRCSYFAYGYDEGPTPAGARYTVKLTPKNGGHTRWCKAKYIAFAATANLRFRHLHVWAHRFFWVG